LFAENARIQMMLGQGMYPEAHHPAADFLGGIKLMSSNTARLLP